MKRIHSVASASWAVRLGWAGLFSMASMSAAACGTASPNRPAQANTSGISGAAGSAAGAAGASGATGTVGAAGAGGTGASGEPAGANDAGADGQETEGGADDGSAVDEAQVEASEASDDGPVATPPLCNPNVAWSDGTPLAISTGADQFGAVTPDERTLVWTSTTSGLATVYYADRTDTTVPFANATPLVLTGIATMPGAIAISPDGLRLALEAPDTTFFTVTRPDRSSPFAATTDTTEFAELNGEISASEAVVALGEPIYGADGETFVYSRYPVGGAQGIATIFQAARGGTDPWSDGVPLNGDAIQEAAAEVRRRPSGISADTLTLFYWDDAAGGEMMAWRATADDSFGNPQSLGPRTGAQPNATCTLLYYSAPADGGTWLFVATAP